MQQPHRFVHGKRPHCSIQLGTTVAAQLRPACTASRRPETKGPERPEPKGRSIGLIANERRSALDQPSSALRPASVIVTSSTSIVCSPILSGIGHHRREPGQHKAGDQLTAESSCEHQCSSDAAWNVGKPSQRAALVACHCDALECLSQTAGPNGYASNSRAKLRWRAQWKASVRWRRVGRNRARSEK